MNKYYIHLSKTTFVIHAANAFDAIGKFWRRQLRAIAMIPLDELNAETLEPFELKLCYAVHQGLFGYGEAVRSAKGIHSLNDAECKLLSKCMAILYGERAYIETARDLEMDSE